VVVLPYIFCETDMAKNTEKLTFEGFLELLKSGRYADGTAARRGVGKCQWTAAKKDEARAAIAAKFGEAGTPAPASKKPVAKKAAPAKSAKAAVAKKAPVAKAAPAPKAKAAPAKKSAPAKNPPVLTHSMFAEAVSAPLPAGLQAQVQITLATGIVRRTTEFYSSVQKLEEVSGATVSKEAAKAVAGEALELVRAAITTMQGSKAEVIYDSFAVQQLLSREDVRAFSQRDELKSFALEGVAMKTPKSLNGKSTATNLDLGQQDADAVTALVFDGFAEHLQVTVT
jgi:hypothetical protein